jgi:DNA repair exonuclease SbcCD nuclease subunit
VVENYAADYPDPVAGWFNIGVLHTSCGRTGHENYAPCTVADLTARGYDYWALGHVHAFEIVSRDPWIVYPGNLQGRSIRECGERGAVIVEVADGIVAEVRRVVTDAARWAEVFVDATPHNDETGLIRAVEADVRPHADAAGGRLLAVRVVLRGATTLHARFIADRDRLRDEVEAAAQRCADNIWLERLRIDTEELQQPPRDAALAEIDLAAALQTREADPALRARVADLIRTVKDKLPGGMAEEDASGALDLDSILAEARALALGRSAEA